MSSPIGQNYGGSPYANLPTYAGTETEAQAIAEKQKRDILDNGWLGAEMKNVNDMLQKSRGQ